MHSHPRIAVMSLLLIGALAVPARAQQSTSQDTRGGERRWSVRAAFGSTRLHSWGDRSEWVDLRVGRTIGSGMTSFDIGIAGSGSPEPFTTLTSGVEFRPWRRALVAPFFRAEGGVLGESDFVGVAVGVGGGVVLRLSSRVGLRAGAALNTHGRAKGPVTYYSGIEYRW